jgi:hypothetical protein
MCGKERIAEKGFLAHTSKFSGNQTEPEEVRIAPGSFGSGRSQMYGDS